MENISQAELDERIALLRKFRSLLEQQRTKFKEYLLVLEKQEDSITSENSEKLIAHTELEQQVLSNILNLQKVIVPMSKIYAEQNIKIGTNSQNDDNSVKTIQAELSSLQEKVLKQNQKNRDLLKQHITQIRQQIATLKNPYKNARSVYAQKATVGNFVAVEV